MQPVRRGDSLSRPYQGMIGGGCGFGSCPNPPKNLTRRATAQFWAIILPQILYEREFLCYNQIRSEFGELAQLVERCDRTAEATGSSPVFSISPSPLGAMTCPGGFPCLQRISSDFPQFSPSSFSPPSAHPSHPQTPPFPSFVA